MSRMNTPMEQVRERLSLARRVTVLTGAGISADSGIPTFRGPDGLWKNFRAEDLATPEAFTRDPVLVWEWYNWRRELIADKKPNPGHRALVDIERKMEYLEGALHRLQRRDGGPPRADSDSAALLIVW
jgi:NAD-dependent SIR2 family protein deacetylase